MTKSDNNNGPIGICEGTKKADLSDVDLMRESPDGLNAMTGSPTRGFRVELIGRATGSQDDFLRFDRDTINLLAWACDRAILSAK